MAPTEEWRPIQGFPGYEVSSLGAVVSTVTWRGTDRRELAGYRNNRGYRMVTLCGTDHRVKRTVHRLVAEAFHGPCPESMEVRHLDGDQLNNCAANLAYGTKTDNAQDSLRHGTNANAAKTKCPRDHTYDAANTSSDKNGRRYCRACKAEWNAARRALRAAGIAVSA